MRVNTRIVMEMASGRVLERASFEYSGPIDRCDRSVQNEAQQGQQQYGTQASTIGNYLTPMLQGWAGGATPGYGQGGVNQMTAAAQTAAGAAGNQAQQKGLLRALRTGNAAGVAAGDVAGAVGAGQNQTQAVQDVLANNAQLKSQQQMGALNMLGSLYGTDVNAQLGEQNTQLKAGQTGWLQQWGGPLLSGISGIPNIGRM